MNSIPSIHCAILGEPLRRYVADPALLGVLERILNASPSDGGVGIPIGNLTSQIFANLYLNDIDHWLTGEPACSDAHIAVDRGVLPYGWINARAQSADVNVQVCD